MNQFAVRNLSVLTYAQGFSLWHYKGDQVTLEQIRKPQFFDDAADMFNPGDMISISAVDGGTILFVKDTSPQVIVESLK